MPAPGAVSVIEIDVVLPLAPTFPPDVFRYAPEGRLTAPLAPLPALSETTTTSPVVVGAVQAALTDDAERGQVVTMPVVESLIEMAAPVVPTAMSGPHISPETDPGLSVGIAEQGARLPLGELVTVTVVAAGPLGPIRLCPDDGHPPAAFGP